MSLKEEMAGKYPTKEGFKVNVTMSQPTQEKWKTALKLAVVSGLINTPFAYKLTNGLVEKYIGSNYSLADSEGKPTTLGLTVHTVIFLILARFLIR